ncbi:hypothetical protein MANES_04G117533v8 [Manihot esculenta]|uniref:Uncharacterized protein n=1 Tax=Manihot esculenta TaxID=3983 RepID=A0ACB7HWE1_MANES|nr:hypothetical protein MANES_04G117533v8 [Manihot esculenta]
MENLNFILGSLLKILCSEACCSCIDSLEFINLRLNRSIKTSMDCCLITHEHDPKGSIYAFDLDSDRCTVELNRLYNPHTSISGDCQFHRDVFGSCNGLLAMYNGEGIVLCNPATREHKTLSRFWGHCYGDYEMLREFGYDALNDDYKVIIMIQNYMENNTRVMVYSWKRKSLTRVEDLLGYSIIPTHNNPQPGGVLVGGSLHWVVNGKGNVKDRVILAFGLGDEKFFELPKPQMESENISLHMVEIGGSLALCSSWPHWMNEIWVMKEYGVMESWTKLFNLTNSNRISGNICIRSHVPVKLNSGIAGSSSQLSKQ